MKFNNLKKGEKLSETQFWTVEKISGDKAQLISEQGNSVVVDNKYVESCLTSAEQYDKVEKITKTEMAAKFLDTLNTAVTINFTKQLKKEDIVKTLANNSGSHAKIADMILAGEERVLTGRLTTTELDDLGYARMIDLKIPKPTSGYDNRLRNINPRNINWMIVNNVKYQIK